MILGLHIRDTKNAGDRASCPLDYFEFPGAVAADMRDAPDCEPDMVIYGGGSIITSPDFHDEWKCPVVAWGVGHHIRKLPWADAMREEHSRAQEWCSMYFPRDDVDGFEVVPCASCMHPVFNERIEPKHSAVCYSAARRVNVARDNLPHMTNEDGGIEDAVRFLASGRTVITSSYHGAYWARLLGRKVEIVPWGSKFFYLPNLSLEQCRDANRRAYLAVMNG